MLKFLVLSAIVSIVTAELPGEYLQEYASSYDDYKPRDYHYSYGVSDPHTGDHKSHWETRENGVVRGAYSLLEPDGTTRLVEYIADDNGFRAVVKKLGGDNHQEVPIVPQIQPESVPLLPAISEYRQPELIATKINQEVPIVADEGAIPEFGSYNGQINNYLKNEVPAELITPKINQESIVLPETAKNTPDYTAYNWKFGNALNTEIPIELITSEQEVPQLEPEYRSDQVNSYQKINNAINYKVPIELIAPNQEVPQFSPEYYGDIRSNFPSQLFASEAKSIAPPELSYLNSYSSNLNNNYKITPNFQTSSDYALPKLEVPRYQSREPQAAFSYQSFSIEPQSVNQGIAFSSGSPSYISNDQYEGYGTAFSHKVYHVVPAPLAKRSTNIKA